MTVDVKVLASDANVLPKFVEVQWRGLAKQWRSRFFCIRIHSYVGGYSARGAGFAFGFHSHVGNVGNVGKVRIDSSVADLER